MSLMQRMNSDFIAAMKSKDELTLSVLRMAKTIMTNKEKETKKLTDDEGLVKIFNGMVKQRKDSIEQFTKGNRPDLANKEKLEIDIISKYLPNEMSLEDMIHAMWLMLVLLAFILSLSRIWGL